MEDSHVMNRFAILSATELLLALAPTAAPTRPASTH